MPKNLMIDPSIVCVLGMDEVYGAMIQILQRRGIRVLSSGSLAPLKESCDVYFDPQGLDARIALKGQQKPKFLHQYVIRRASKNIVATVMIENIKRYFSPLQTPMDGGPNQGLIEIHFYLPFFTEHFEGVDATSKTQKPLKMSMLEDSVLNKRSYRTSKAAYYTDSEILMMYKFCYEFPDEEVRRIAQAVVRFYRLSVTQEPLESQRNVEKLEQITPPWLNIFKFVKSAWQSRTIGTEENKKRPYFIRLEADRPDWVNRIMHLVKELKGRYPA